MEDLTHLLGDPINSLAPTSQAGGNQIFSNANAQTAPGSQPASPATSITGEVIDHDPPEVVATGSKLPVGSGTRSRDTTGSEPPRPAWKNTPAAGSGPVK